MDFGYRTAFVSAFSYFPLSPSSFLLYVHMVPISSIQPECRLRFSRRASKLCLWLLERSLTNSTLRRVIEVAVRDCILLDVLAFADMHVRARNALSHSGASLVL